MILNRAHPYYECFLSPLQIPAGMPADLAQSRISYPVPIPKYVPELIPTVYFLILYNFEPGYF